jgi:transcriptional regulator with XRE-family HTH domain
MVTKNLNIKERNMEKAEDEFGLRVRAVRKIMGLSQQKFAKKIGVSGPFMSEIETGKYKPGYDFFYNMMTRLNVNINYLMLGEGPMFNPIEDPDKMPVKKLFGPVQNGRELLWYIERSQLFMHTLMGFATKFIYENKEYLKREIEEYQENESD